LLDLHGCLHDQLRVHQLLADVRFGRHEGRVRVDSPDQSVGKANANGTLAWDARVGRSVGPQPQPQSPSKASAAKAAGKSELRGAVRRMSNVAGLVQSVKGAMASEGPSGSGVAAQEGLYAEIISPRSPFA
jgi:hypothetical protein